MKNYAQDSCGVLPGRKVRMIVGETDSENTSDSLIYDVKINDVPTPSYALSHMLPTFIILDGYTNYKAS